MQSDFKISELMVKEEKSKAVAYQEQETKLLK